VRLALSWPSAGTPDLTMIGAAYIAVQYAGDSYFYKALFAYLAAGAVFSATSLYQLYEIEQKFK